MAMNVGEDDSDKRPIYYHYRDLEMRRFFWDALALRKWAGELEECECEWCIERYLKKSGTKSLNNLTDVGNI